MKQILLLVATLLGIATFAQNSYTLTTYTSNYELLSNPIPVEFMDVEDGYWDNPIFTIPFGFDFELGGQTYNSTTQFTNGSVMGFGDLFNPNTTVFSFFGITDDLIDGSYLQGLDSSIISYQIFGSPGNQIAKIQYQNAAFIEEVEGPEPAAENRTDFQLWFYEQNGVMEVHYGNSNIPNPELVYVGNMGPSPVLILNYNIQAETIQYGAAITGDPTDPALSTFIEIPGENFQVSLDAVPLTGRVHRLAPSGGVGIRDARIPEFSIYPTVVQSEIWVKDAHEAKATYRILDINGKEVQMGSLTPKSSINVSSLNGGVYLFTIDGMGYAAKFMKQ